MTASVLHRFLPEHAKRRPTCYSEVCVAYQNAVPGDPPSVEPLADRTESLGVGRFNYFLDGSCWEWTRDVATTLGYHREAVEPSLELLLQHTHLEDRSRIAADLRRIVQGHRVSSRYRIIDRAGDLHWIVLVGEPLESEPGESVGAAGYFIDVTDAVQAGVTAAMSELTKSRAVVEQAKGVLMAAHGISADEAFARLVRRSQHTNVKLREIASQFLAGISGKLQPKPQADILLDATARSRVDRWADSAALA
jgi:PAS domain S-box-containing protein